MNIKDMMEKAQELQKKMEEVQDDLSHKKVEFSSGAGMVTAIVNGKNELLDLKFSDDALKPENLDMIKDLIISAVNGAMQKANELMQEEMQKVTSGMGFPPNLNI